MHNYDELVARAVELRQAGYSCQRTAELLDAAGFHRPSDGGKLSKDAVSALLSRSQMPLGYRRRTTYACYLGAEERWLSDLAVDLDMPYPSLHAWNRRGRLRARKIEEAGGMLAVEVTAEELSRLRELRDHRREYPYVTPPTSLTTPRIKTSRTRRSNN